MKTLVWKDTNVSLFLWADGVPVVVGDVMTQAGDPVDMHILDCTSASAVLHENVTAPDDWFGCKYLFDGTAWTPNPDWVAPEPIPQPE